MIRALWALLMLAFFAAQPATAGTIPPGSIPALATPLRILPLGDSITLGSWTNGGYRLPLQQMLAADGLAFDFIGPLTDNSTGMLDPEHAGFSGYRIEQIQAQVATVNDTPDVVLVDVGTNDLYQGYQLATVNDRLDSLLVTLRTRWPGAHVIVATVGPYAGEQYSEIGAMNAAAMSYNAHIEALQGVTVARMVLAPDQLQDGIHPNMAGYQVMAETWRDAMTVPAMWWLWLPWLEG